MGYWEGLAPAADVDWCEANYVVTPYIAEFWNTLSSLPMAMLGVYGAYQSISRGRESRFFWCFVLLAMVGLGSAAFHGTLLRPSQALDELPMIYTSLLGFWVLRYRHAPSDEGRKVAWGLGVYSLLFTFAYLTSKETFMVFVLSYAVMVGWLVIKSVRLTWYAPAPERMSTLLRLASIGYLGSFFFCWLPEHVLLPCDHWFQALPLHSIWHIGAGFGTFLWFEWAIEDRSRR